MKVFAHYLGDDKNWNLSKDGFQYRWRTILQFGDSWDVIGSIVMKNPGSAAPLRKVADNYIQDCLRSFGDEHDWYEFSVGKDKTLPLVEKLFVIRNGGKALDGVIQVFNLFNIRNADLDAAIESSTIATETVLSTLDDDIEAMRRHVCPIYIGWGALGADQRFKDKANKIFQFLRREMKQEYLFSKFKDNKFYHPLYLMGRGKNNPNSMYLLNAFCQNTQNPEYKCTISPKIIVSKKEVYDEVLERLKTRKNIAEKTMVKDTQKSRFKLNENLEITITVTGGGYIGIRHLNYKQKYSIFEYPNTDKYRQVLDEFGYDMTQDMWLGTKSFKKYGTDMENVVESILNEIEKLQKSLS